MRVRKDVEGPSSGISTADAVVVLRELNFWEDALCRSPDADEGRAEVLPGMLMFL